MSVSPAASCGASASMTPSTAAAGIMTQIVRGGGSRLDELAERGRGGESRRRATPLRPPVAGVSDAFMAGAEPPARHVRAHSAEPDEAELHEAAPTKCSNHYATTRAAIISVGAATVIDRGSKTGERMGSISRATTAALASTALSPALLAQSRHSHDFSAERLVAPPTDGWLTNGGNLYNQRYSPLNQIDTANVAGLKGVWRARLNGSGAAPQYSGEAQPVVHDGVAYVSTGANDVFALSLDTGEILWQYAANLPADLPSVCCGWNNRGVAISRRQSLHGAGSTASWSPSIAQRARPSGRFRPSVPRRTSRSRRRRSTTTACSSRALPARDRGTRGRVKAYAADDGALLWTFYTIPGPGEPGHETWPQDNEAWKYGGASVWQTPAIDPELGLVYFSTGNAGPDYNGAVRAGDNLYLGVDRRDRARDGEVPLAFPASAPRHLGLRFEQSGRAHGSYGEGGARKAIVEVGKTGWAYILDRETGEPLIGIDERAVPQEPAASDGRDATVSAWRCRRAAARRHRSRRVRRSSTRGASSRRSSAKTRRS